MIAYFNGRYLGRDEVRISPDDRGFLFADGLYEVIRSYRGRLFRVAEHLDRLNYGAAHLRLPITSFGYLAEVAGELVRRNQLNDVDALVYFQVTRGAAQRGHAFPESQPELTVYGAVSRFDPALTWQGRQDGVAVITVPDQRWARCDLKTVGLTANVLACQLAKEAGAVEAILVRDGVLIEGTHSNFMAVIDDTLVTAPASNYILSGITRMTVLELCTEHGIAVDLRPVLFSAAGRATEMMLVGTTVEVTPIIRMDGRTIGSGRPGPVARLLQGLLEARISHCGVSPH
jgi:D-alanine transaminase